jgi:hypothetical protein
MDERAEELAEQAFAAIQADAPPEVARWHDLHEVERRHLVRFAHAILRLAAA